MRVAEPAGRTRESIVVGSFLLAEVNSEFAVVNVNVGTLYRPRTC